MSCLTSLQYDSAALYQGTASAVPAWEVRTGDIMDTLNRRHHGHFCLFFGSQTGLEAKADALESEKYFGRTKGVP